MPLLANESAAQVIGDGKFRIVAVEFITQAKKDVTIDWNLRERPPAKINVMVKRILNKYGYQSDLQEA